MAKDHIGQLKVDVPADSSPAQDSAEDTTPAGDPVADTGEQSVAGKGEKPGRSINEVRGEVLRKMDERISPIQEQLAEIKGMLSVRQAPSQPAAPDASQLTAEQLEAMRPNIPAGQMAAFEKMVAERRISELVRGQISQEFSVRETEQARDRAVADAFQRYPDLHNSASPLRKMTNKVLDERKADPSKNPTVVLDAANEAASRLGISPTARRASNEPDVRGVGGRTAPAGGKPAASTLSDEKHDAISKALGGALGRGKTFDREKMKQAHAEYTTHRNLIVKQ